MTPHDLTQSTLGVADLPLRAGERREGERELGDRACIGCGLDRDLHYAGARSTGRFLGCLGAQLAERRQVRAVQSTGVPKVSHAPIVGQG